MTRKEAKKIIDEAIGTPCTFDGTPEPNEYHVYTGIWFIETETLDKIRERINVLKISVESESITLLVKL